MKSVASIQGDRLSIESSEQRSTAQQAKAQPGPEAEVLGA